MSAELNQILLDRISEVRDDLKTIRQELKEDLQRTRHDIRDEMGGRVRRAELRLEEAEKKIDEVHTKVATNTGRDRVILWGGAAALTAALNWIFKSIGSVG